MLRPRERWPAASTLQTAPAVEPITTQETKEHLRVDVQDDDALIDNMIKAARQHVEQSRTTALITQTWDAFYAGWPTTSGALIVPRPPLQSVTEVEYTDEDGTATTLAASEYNVDADSFPGRIVLKRSNTWPTDLLDTAKPIRVRFVAGYGGATTDIPEDIRHALLLIVERLYEHRGDSIVGTSVVEIPYASRVLLNAHRKPLIA